MNTIKCDSIIETYVVLTSSLPTYVLTKKSKVTCMSEANEISVFDTQTCAERMLENIIRPKNL